MSRHVWTVQLTTIQTFWYWFQFSCSIYINSLNDSFICKYQQIRNMQEILSKQGSESKSNLFNYQTRSLHWEFLCYETHKSNRHQKHWWNVVIQWKGRLAVKNQTENKSLVLRFAYILNLTFINQHTLDLLESCQSVHRFFCFSSEQTWLRTQNNLLYIFPYFTPTQ